jgi:hypothetical protein
MPYLECPHRRLPVVCRTSAAAPTSTWGCMVTLNSDDPAFFGSDLWPTNTYWLIPNRDLPPTNCANWHRNSISASFLPDPRRKQCGWTRIDSTRVNKTRFGHATPEGRNTAVSRHIQFSQYSGIMFRARRNSANVHRNRMPSTASQEASRREIKRNPEHPACHYLASRWEWR